MQLNRCVVAIMMIVFFNQSILPETVHTSKKKVCKLNYPKNKRKYYENQKVLIHSGTFEMGDNQGEEDERPAHSVTIDAFRIDEHEVTNAEYLECVKNGKCTFAHYNDGHCNVMTETGWWEGFAPSVFKELDKPVTCVNYYEAKQYCEWKGGRLPTEAEFEYALRANSKTKYYWGEAVDKAISYANGADLDGKRVFEGVYNNLYPSYVNGHDKNVYTAPVESYKPNGFGLYDMTGNAAEWCNDWYKKYDPSKSVNPVGPDTGTHRVVRGGGAEANPDHLVSTYRDRSLPFYRELYIGFRCVYKP